MRGYKAFNKGWKCRDFQYELGKTYELGEGEVLAICACGFHFCKNPIDVFGYYPMNDNTVIAEVEALGKIQQKGTKYVTDKIRIIKEFTEEDLQALILDGEYNTGGPNSGTHNSGDYNSGHYNSGNCNSGNSNSGNCNSGNYNSGDCNSGKHNSGDYNWGSYNSGDCNSGYRNSGNFNSGHCNSGNFNSGNFNSGMFNIDEPKMRIFNKECDMTYAQFVRGIDYDISVLLRHIYDKKLTDTDWKHIRELPNYDTVIFEEVTGIKDEQYQR